MAVMPGALTPTEVVQAWTAGADFVKVFPAGAVGGPSYLKALKAPLPQIELVLAIGSYAQRFHLGDEVGASLQETMITWRQHLRRKRHPRVLPLPHPSWHNNAWLKQNPWFETELLPVLRRKVRPLLQK